MCTFSMEHFYTLLNAPQNINEYHYIWGSDLREFGLKGFGVEKVYCKDLGVSFHTILVPKKQYPHFCLASFSPRHWKPLIKHTSASVYIVWCG